MPSGVSPLGGGYSEFGEREGDGGNGFDKSDGVQQGRGKGPKDGSQVVVGRALLPDRPARVGRAVVLR